MQGFNIIRTNLCRDPSFEAAFDDPVVWALTTTGSAGAARVTSTAYSGTYSLEYSCTSGTSTLTILVPADQIESSRVYVASIYARKSVANVSATLRLVQGSTTLDSATASITSTSWNRFSVEGATVNDTQDLEFRILLAAGDVIFSDAVQIEIGHLSEYFDGSTNNNADWLGVTHKSASVYHRSTLPEAFSAEADSNPRSIAQGVLVSWKKDIRPNIKIFTIGVSTIGGNDVIGEPGGVNTAWNKYLYYEETSRVLDINYERSLSIPVGGLNVALAEINFDNTSGRYTPRYMGGNSEIATAVEPRKPIIISAGFKIDGVDQTIPQFVGIGTRMPEVDLRRKTMRFVAADFNDFLANRFLDNSVMFTGQRTDQVMEDLLVGMGYTTAEYDLDEGINLIPFGLFEAGTKYQSIFNELVESEYGQFYQDEQGILRFENRQHWDNYPHNLVQMVISTAEVLEARTPREDHIINVVEVRGKPRTKQPLQLIFKLAGPLEIPAGSDKELFINFDDPILATETPTFLANEQSDGSGTDRTSSVYLKASDVFATAAKYIYHNNHTAAVFITELTIYGRPAKIFKDIYVRKQDDSSVTAFEERVLQVENDYIASEDWANSLAQLILDDFAEVENLQEIVVKAKPQLQLGDLISWQGRYWRIFGIKTTLHPSYGFVQELRLLQRAITTYFRIGISTIGGTDQVAP